MVDFLVNGFYTLLAWAFLLAVFGVPIAVIVHVFQEDKRGKLPVLPPSYKTIGSSGYEYDGDGTSWLVQRVRFTDCVGIEKNTARFDVLASYPTYREAMEHYGRLSGKLDNRLQASFYRVVEAHEGEER